MKPKSFKKIINKKIYNTETATLLSGDDFWDGSNFERKGRNQFLYKTRKNNYFIVNLTKWQGERDDLIAISKDEAINFFENHSEKRVEFEEAFPDVKIEEA